jgi:3-deoxy-D-manno-octulosonic acid kinase
MTNDGARRMLTPTGAMLTDPACPDALLDTAAESLFEPRFWAARQALSAIAAGRGAAWFIECGTQHWVLRHYRRGGFIARFAQDRYLWTGEPSVRAFAEFRLLAELARRGLPVPRPIGARYRRAGMTYRCDLIMERIAGGEPLSAVLAAAAPGEALWERIGAVIARLHRCHVDHADLNAHNILIDPAGAVSIVDFDRGRIRAPGAWSARNLRRLHRSLLKISGPLPAGRFSPRAWESLLRGYDSAAAENHAPSL